MKTIKVLLLLVVLILTGCKQYWYTMLVTKENCRIEYPCIPCPDPVIIDETFVLDTIVFVDGIATDVYIDLKKKYELAKEVIMDTEDFLIEIQRDRDSLSRALVTVTRKKHSVTVRQPDTSKIMATLRTVKVERDSLYTMVFELENELRVKDITLDTLNSRTAKKMWKDNKALAISMIVLLFVALCIIVYLIFRLIRLI